MGPAPAFPSSVILDAHPSSSDWPRSRWHVPFRRTMLVVAFPLATALSYAAPFRAPPLLRAPARAAVLMQSVTPADQSPVEQFTGLVRGDLSFQAVRTGADVDTPGLAICSPDDCTTVVPAEVVHTAKVGSYFGLYGTGQFDGQNSGHDFLGTVISLPFHLSF